MLVLSRRLGESVQIGTSRVKVLEIRGDRIRLGIEAAPEIDVMRTELLPVDEPLELVEA